MQLPLTEVVSLEQRWLSGGLFRFPKVAQANARKPIASSWVEIHLFSTLQ